MTVAMGGQKTLAIDTPLARSTSKPPPSTWPDCLRHRLSCYLLDPFRADGRLRFQPPGYAGDVAGPVVPQVLRDMIWAQDRQLRAEYT